VARQSFSQHFVPTLEAGQCFNMPTWMSARLIELAGMCPDVTKVEQGGPEWTFHRQGKVVVTKPRFTLSLSDGRSAYWSAAERPCDELPDWAKVQQFHAKHEGSDSWVLTDAFVRNEAVEFTNRTRAYYMLVHAIGWDSADIECEILMALDAGPRPLNELAVLLARPFNHVYAAALRLWKRRLVELPMKSQLINENWVVEGGQHARKS
jgi:hypothetical protein